MKFTSVKEIELFIVNNALIKNFKIMKISDISYIVPNT